MTKGSNCKENKLSKILLFSPVLFILTHIKSLRKFPACIQMATLCIQLRTLEPAQYCLFHANSYNPVNRVDPVYFLLTGSTGTQARVHLKNGGHSVILFFHLTFNNLFIIMSFK